LKNELGLQRPEYFKKEEMSIEKILLPETNLRKELKDIWMNYYQDKPFFSPLAPEYVKSNSILFLSINPSVRNDSKKDIDIEFYPTVCSETPKGEYHNHFSKFFILAKEANINDWFCMDLLFVRDTNQNNISEKRHTDFIHAQAKLTIEIIKKAKPTLVIVSNNLASIILHEVDSDNFLLTENNIYTFHGIPIIIRESKFLGSRILSNNIDRRKKLMQEIQRVRMATLS